MATKSTQVSYKAGDVLFRQDDAAARCFVINAGHVRLTRRVFREEFVVETLGPGNLCGEVAVVGGARYPCSAVAIEPVNALAVERDDIDKQLLANAEIASRLAKKLAARIAHTHFRLGNFALRTVVARVMLQLRYEAKRSGALDGEAYAPIPFDLAEVLAAEKGAVDEAIRELITACVVEIDGNGRFRITDTEAFDRLLAYHELAGRFEK